jgi:hypothetical protein
VTLIGLIVALWLGSATASAQVWTVPPGLNPGDKYRLVFVTDGNYRALSKHISDYNTFVTDQANEANSVVKGLGITWRALASTESESAKKNTFTDNGLGVPIYTLSGIRVADNYSTVYDQVNDVFGLWGGTLRSPINVTQSLNSIQSGVVVSTGTEPDGSSALNHWLGVDPIYPYKGQVRIGYANKTDSQWISHIDQNTDEYRRFYALSGELTAVPEPSTLGLGFALALAGAAWSIRRGNRKAEPSADTASF